RESVSRDFQVAVAPLQITFACHPGGGDFSGAILSAAYEKAVSRSFIVSRKLGHNKMGGAL
ncbi:hypothetical protein, partial [uncultured Dialister sp.]|uniref:hypothetical protein n=1 Tax=uncultured Dialister sp. TaxID=278064 RepID=UPI0025F60D7F